MNVDFFFQNLAILNNSKVLAGISMILMNLGSRHIASDLGVIHNNILSSEIFKKLIIFAMFFVATRDVITAFMLTLSYVLVVDGILHEKRKFCIVPKKYITYPNISLDSYSRAKTIISEYESQEKEKPIDVMEKQTPIETVYDVYMKNLSLFQTKLQPILAHTPIA